MWKVSAVDRDGREVARAELATGELTIGRDSDRQLVMPSASVSRRHARLLSDGSGQLVIVDEGSANGVVVDGIRVTVPTVVGPTSRIEVAEFRLAIEPLGGSLALPVVSPPQVSRAEMMNLVAEQGPYDGRVFPLPMGVSTVGRALENDLVFDDPSLSRKHSRLHRDGPGRFTVEDLGSSNGTFVNNRKVGGGPVVSGDILRFGDLSFRVDGPELGSTRYVDPTLTPTKVGLLLGTAAVTLLILISTVVVLFRKAPTRQAPGKEAIVKIARQADSHLRAGRSLYREKKYSEAKADLEEVLALDPANVEARQLRLLAAHGADDDRALSSAQAALTIGDRKGLESALHLLSEISERSPAHAQLQSRITPALVRFGLDRCAERSANECAWALCRAFEVASEADRPDARIARLLSETERKLSRDRSYVRCRKAP